MQQFNIAQLYLRFVIGITLSLHNIYKLQNIEKIVESYPPNGVISNIALFYLIVTVQVVCSIMLMIGLYVRTSAAILTLGTISILLILFPHISTCEIEAYTLYIFLFIYLLITGGGNYAIGKVLR